MGKSASHKGTSSTNEAVSIAKLRERISLATTLSNGRAERDFALHSLKLVWLKIQNHWSLPQKMNNSILKSINGPQRCPNLEPPRVHCFAMLRNGPLRNFCRQVQAFLGETSPVRHWQPPIELFLISEELQHDITPNPAVEQWERKSRIRTVLWGWSTSIVVWIEFDEWSRSCSFWLIKIRVWL